MPHRFISFPYPMFFPPYAPPTNCRQSLAPRRRISWFVLVLFALMVLARLLVR